VLAKWDLLYSTTTPIAPLLSLITRIPNNAARERSLAGTKNAMQSVAFSAPSDRHPPDLREPPESPFFLRLLPSVLSLSPHNSTANPPNINPTTPTNPKALPTSNAAALILFAAALALVADDAAPPAVLAAAPPVLLAPANPLNTPLVVAPAAPPLVWLPPAVVLVLTTNVLVFWRVGFWAPQGCWERQLDWQRLSPLQLATHSLPHSWQRKKGRVCEYSEMLGERPLPQMQA